jgi:hypothetical protein
MPSPKPLDDRNLLILLDEDYVDFEFSYPKEQ